MDDVVRITRSCAIPQGELRFRFSRSGGPGGQNVNTRDTRVELLFDVATSPSLGPHQRAHVLERLSSRIDSEGRLRVVVSRERTQARNRELAVERFRELMAGALTPPAAPRVKTKPSRAARDRRLREKRARSKVKRARGRPQDD